MGKRNVGKEYYRQLSDAVWSQHGGSERRLSFNEWKPLALPGGTVEACYTPESSVIIRHPGRLNLRNTAKQVEGYWDTMNHVKITKGGFEETWEVRGEWHQLLTPDQITV